MAFCANCGSEVSGQFCPKCGTAVAGGASSAGLPPASSSGISSNLASALCYIPIIAIIFLLIAPYNKDRGVRFHAWQSIFLWVFLFVLRVVIGQLWFISWGLVALLEMLLGLGELALVIFLGYKAYNNERIVLPFIGPLAEKQA